MAINLQSMGIGAGAGLNGIAGASLTPAPVGVKAKSPTLPQLNNSLPKTQAVNDLSSKYANVDGTIYDKNTGTAFSNPQDFYKASGTNTFNNTKFDTSWKPVSNQPPSMMNTATQNLTPAIPAPPTPAPAPATGNYTPPNQGTTGVSQGGIIGNLLNQGNGQQSQAVTDATNALKTDEQQQASQIAAYGGVGDSNLALGRTGLVNQLYASKIAADQAAVQNALTSQGQQIGATESAGGLNAPIVNPQTQGLVSPSQNATTNSTTSGGSLASMIGTRTNATGQTEYYNASAPGQPGFATPQALADFVNQQMPGSNATAANVFGLLQSQNGQAVQPNNPYYQTLQTAASLLASNQVSAANDIMGSMTSAVKAQVYQLAKAQGYNANTAAGEAAAQQSNTATAGTAAVNAGLAAYTNAYPAVQQLNQALNNISTAGGMTVQNAQGNNVNPFTFAPANDTLAQAKTLLSDSGQVTFNSNIANLKNSIEGIYASNGGSTPTDISNQINQMADGSLSISGLQALIAAAQQEGQGRLTNAKATAQSEYQQTQGSTTSQFTNGQTSADGSLIYQNGQWQVK